MVHRLRPGLLYRVPLQAGAPAGPPLTVPLGGDWTQVEGSNANGIASTPSGSALLVVNARFGTPDPTQAPYEIVKVDGS